ncbi:uncharacterized protein [Epargyreus clarus]|uniref:uncharacterized protein isoform X3 n=1 Tax=Epargyreus clarus TaxID=520877 RepID=UPI003C2B6744
MEVQNEILGEYAKSITNYYKNEETRKPWYPMFYQGTLEERNKDWVKENHKRFLKGTKNEIAYNRWYCSELGAITALTYAPNGSHIIVGHSSGMIQLNTSVDDPPEFCIRADPAVESMTTQFYGTPGISSNATPFITQRSAALSLSVTADETKIVVGYADSSIKVYDLETQEADLTYKVHKLRLQFIPKKLQRMHFGQVCALRCHDQRSFVFASGAWDQTLRIWDIRCKVGCVMTFEGVDICSDSIDLNRDHCIAGSWQPTEALTVWDLVARKRLNVVRVQNRRPNVDGEYIHACRYWRSTMYNRKGKYAIIGGSGTNCVEVVNLHNRYIACSYPAAGSVLAVASHQERIAFGGTAPVLNIVSFHDPKHEDYDEEVEVESGYTKAEVTWYDEDDLPLSEPDPEKREKATSSISHPLVSSISQRNA